ncbi:MAG TPA: hypothetical protein VGL13_13925, partial [Polyangiaceae bacterium]
MADRFWLCGAFALALMGCSSSAAPGAPTSLGDAGANGVTDGGFIDGSSAPTFHKDVEALLQTHCDMCHLDNGIAPMSLVTYEQAKPYAALIADRTSSRLMPPWGAVSTSDCSPPLSWKDDPTLSDSQIAILAAWSAAGAPEGDPADAPPAFTAQAIALSGVNADLAPPSPWVLTDTTQDDFRCFVLDPSLTDTTYLNGSFVVPGNAQVVHHALVFADPTGASKALITDPATQSYECFGGPGVAQTSLLAAWAPGGLPTDYPENVGAPLAAGTLLVMQVHYHPHTVTPAIGPDQTHFQMRLTSTKPQYFALTILPGNFQMPVGPLGNGLLPGPDDPSTGPAFVIPPNVAGHTETMQFTIPQAMRTLNLPSQLAIFSIAGHEHYVGSAVRVDVHHASP